jgi:hypothetical protein
MEALLFEEAKSTLIDLIQEYEMYESGAVECEEENQDEDDDDDNEASEAA